MQAIGASLQLSMYRKKVALRLQNAGATILSRPDQQGEGAVSTDCRASAFRFHMLLPEKLNAFGLALYIIGFSILFALALPAVMRRHFITSDRVG